MTSKLSEIMIKKKRQTPRIWEEPEYRKRMSMISKERWNDPEHREKQSKIMSKIMKEMWANPEYREKLSQTMTENMKRRWAEPGYREKVSKTMKKRWTDPEFRDKMSGENSPKWRGGVSFEPYPPDFNKTLKSRIRERDGSRCTLCGEPKGLHVHHINYDKMDSRPKNLVTICQTCHGHIHASSTSALMDR